MSLFSIVYLYTHSFNDVIAPHDVFHYHLRTKKMRRWQRTMIPQDHPLQWQRQNQSQAAAPLVIMEALVRTSLGYQATFSNNFTAQKKKDTSSCTDMVLHEKSKPIYKRSMAKSNLALDERADTSRPTLRRQLAKNNFDLDTQDLQTLAMALESKYQKDNEKAPGETPSTPKKKEWQSKGQK